LGWDGTSKGAFGNALSLSLVFVDDVCTEGRREEDTDEDGVTTDVVVLALGRRETEVGNTAPARRWEGMAGTGRSGNEDEPEGGEGSGIDGGPVRPLLVGVEDFKREGLSLDL
jgi:hypothetical protein